VVCSVSNIRGCVALIFIIRHCLCHSGSYMEKWGVCFLSFILLDFYAKVVCTSVTHPTM